MRRVTAAFGGIAVVILAASVLAQAAPNFSGKWTPDTQKNATLAPAERPAGAPPRPMTIKQNDKSFTIESTDSTGPTSLTYDFDKPMVVDSSLGKATASAKVVGSTVAIATVPIGATAGRVRTYSMDGKLLLVTTSLPGKNGAEPTINKIYYKKG
jgi:hypothetical protein